MTIVLAGLPVIVEMFDSGRPTAFWWNNRRHAIVEYVCHWDDLCSVSEHWLVVSEAELPVSLIYDHERVEWFLEWVDD